MDRDSTLQKSCAAFFLGWFFLGIASIRGQDAPEPTRDPAIAEKIESIETSVRDRKMRTDAGAARLLDELGTALVSEEPAPSLHEDDRDAILGLARKILTKGKLRPPEQAALYEVAGSVLSRGGDTRDAKTLIKVLEKKRILHKPEWAKLRGRLIVELGKMAEPKAIDFLVERATRDRYDAILAAAGEALGHYEKADQKVRKAIVKALIVKLGEVEATASRPVSADPNAAQDFGPYNAVITLQAIAVPWRGTLSKLTGQSHDTGHDWQQWFNKHKKDEW